MDALVHAVTALVSRLGSVASGANPLAVWGTALQSGATQGSFAATIGSLLSTIAQQVGTATTMTIRACLAIVRAVLTKAMPSIATLWWLGIAFVVLACVSIAISMCLEDGEGNAYAPQEIALIFVKGVFYEVPKYILTKAYELVTPAVGKLLDYLWPQRDTLEHLKTEVEGRIRRLRAAIQRGDEMAAIQMLCDNIREKFRGIQHGQHWSRSLKFYYQTSLDTYVQTQSENGLLASAKEWNVLGATLLSKLSNVTTFDALRKWAFGVTVAFKEKMDADNVLWHVASLMLASYHFNMRAGDTEIQREVHAWLQSSRDESLGQRLKKASLTNGLLAVNWTLDPKQARNANGLTRVYQTWHVIDAILKLVLAVMLSEQVRAQRKPASERASSQDASRVRAAELDANLAKLKATAERLHARIAAFEPL